MNKVLSKISVVKFTASAAFLILIASCSTLQQAPESAQSPKAASAETVRKSPQLDISDFGAETIEPGVLTVGYTDIWVDGYLDQDETGPHGMDAEIAAIIAAQFNLDIDWILVPSEGNFFESVRKTLNGRKIDMFISVTSILPDREKSVLFSVPYAKEKEDIGIALRLDNISLKNAVDSVLDKLGSDGTLAKLHSEYVEPLTTIYTTHNVMNTLKGIYFIEDCRIDGNEDAMDQVSMVEINYDKTWIEYGFNGGIIRNLEILFTDLSVLSVKVINSKLNPDDEGSVINFEYDLQQLKDTGRIEFQTRGSDDIQVYISMIKGE